MNQYHYYKKAAGSVFLTWLLFLGIDFLFHASMLQSFWDDEIPAILDEMLLFQRIPFGYASFLLLTLLVFYLLRNIYGRFPKSADALIFGIWFGGLFSLSNFMGQFSYLTIPAEHLMIFNLVYFIELVFVSWSLALLINNLKRSTILGVMGIFILLIMTGIVLQNIL